MGKAARLAEKKKKLNDKEKMGKPALKLTIEIDENQNMQVDGPINDPLLFMRILAGAMNTVADYIAKQNEDIKEAVKDKEEKRIILAS